MCKYLMAIDAGTGSVRALIFDTNGKQIACAQKEWTHKSDPKYPGSMDFDWAYNWSLTLECIKDSIRLSKVDPKNIQAISACCMREGLVLYDIADKEIWSCANVDSRAGDEAVYLKENYPELEEVIYHKSGQSHALDAIPRLLWVKRNLPEIYDKTHRVGMFNDWITEKLCGLPHVEPSNGSTTGLINLKTRDWDQEIFKLTGLNPDICPPVLECGQVLGYVTETSAMESGLYPGTPVVVGGGDAQVASLGVGASEPDDAAVFGGSFWQFEYNTSEPKTDPKLRVRVNCHVIPELWQYEAIAFQPGLAMRWFRDAFCSDLRGFYNSEYDSIYAYFDSKAKLIKPGSNGMVACFSDVMDFLNWKHAAPSFINFQIDPEKFNLFTFYRSILESAAFVTRGNIELVEDVTGSKPEHIIFAGGASNSDLWAQILSDVLNLEVRVPEIKEASGLGTAILAGHGVGIYPNILEAAKRLAIIKKVFKPNSDNVSAYNAAYANWQKIYKAQLQLADEKVTDSLWRAPGC